MSVPPVRIRVSACIPDGDRILMVEHDKGGHRYWLLPGGGVDVGETLVDALRRELGEETGFDIAVGRLIIVCESIEPEGRHILNLVFSAELRGGTLTVGRDGVLSDVGWKERDELRTLDTFPPIAEEILGCWAESFQGPLRYLGNVWRR